MSEKIDSRLMSAYEHYAELCKTTQDNQILVGRIGSKNNVDEKIFLDILKKLQVRKESSILVIGIGCGLICEFWLKAAIELNLNIFLNDFSPVIEKIKENILPKYKNKKIKLELVSGIFPIEVKRNLDHIGFDYIDIYSVIHYSSYPEMLIFSALELLNPGGRFLIGDIPNLDKKGRFLSSAVGRNFDAKYRNKTLNEIPIYKDHYEFSRAAVIQGATKIDDEFVCTIIKKCRDRGHDAFILDQPIDLPFCHTREDILIVKKNE